MSVFASSCQIPGCAEPATEVQWFSYRACWRSRRLERRVRAGRPGAGAEWLRHVHRCVRHGHVHLCHPHYLEHVTAGEGEPMALGIGEDGIVADPAALAQLSYPDDRNG